MTLFVYERVVRFDEVDAARIVFFARILGYCHEAMESFFDALPGGYVALIDGRKIGLPAVHVEADFKAPLKFGDHARISVALARIGTKSATFQFDITRDAVSIGRATHVVAITDLERMKAIEIPADVRALFEGHLVI